MALPSASTPWLVDLTPYCRMSASGTFFRTSQPDSGMSVGGRADLARDALLVRAGVGTGQGLVATALIWGASMQITGARIRLSSTWMSVRVSGSDPHRIQSIALLRATPWVK
jgi:hypothetical protein